MPATATSNPSTPKVIIMLSESKLLSLVATFITEGVVRGSGAVVFDLEATADIVVFVMSMAAGRF